MGWPTRPRMGPRSPSSALPTSGASRGPARMWCGSSRPRTATRARWRQWRPGAGSTGTSRSLIAPPSDRDDAGPLCLLRHNRQLSTTKLVRLPSREDLAEMAVAAGSREPAPLAPVHCTPQALPSASASNCPSVHHHERGSPMKNRKREICTSGSVRDEDGQPPHLLGRRNFLHLAACAAALPVVSRVAWAQAYPSRPITMIVPFPAGGPTDTIGRIVAEGMRVSLRQPIIIKNVTGAGGTIGVGRVARAVPDGYTLSVGFLGTHVLNGAIYTLQYDVLRDFEPVALLASNPQLIVAKSATPAKSLNELIAWLKANPGKASQGTAGVGSPAHVSGAYFQKETGTHFQFVPYRGAAPAMQDLVAGQIDLMFDQALNSLPHVRSGKIKAYAVTANTRLAAAPEIPTVDEAGLPGFYISVWSGMWAPKGTPKDVVAKLNAAVVDALAHPTVRQQLADLGQQVPPRDQQTPEALRAFQKAEIEKWWPIIKAANIKAQ